MNRYTMGVTALGGALALALAGVLHDSRPLVLARLALYGAALAAVAAIDVRERRIPNRLVLPAAVACFALAVVAGVRIGDLTVALAIVAGCLVLPLVWPRSLGLGDVKLALIVAVGLDGRAMSALAAGFVLAALAGVLLLVRQGRAAGGRAIPLAPFLAAGCLLALLA